MLPKHIKWIYRGVFLMHSHIQMYVISRLKVLESIPSPVVTACHWRHKQNKSLKQHVYQTYFRPSIKMEREVEGERERVGNNVSAWVAMSKGQQDGDKMKNLIKNNLLGSTTFKLLSQMKVPTFPCQWLLWSNVLGTIKPGYTTASDNGHYVM